MEPSGTPWFRAVRISVLKFGVLLQIHDRLVGAVREARIEDFLELPPQDPRARDQGRHLAFLNRLPRDELLHVGMVEVETDHLRRPARGAAGFDGARRAIADLEERHEARRAAASRKRLAITAQAGEVGAGPRTVFEEAGFAHPQIHDAAVIDQIVVHRLDEAGVRLGVFVGAGRGLEFARLGVRVPVALGGAGDAVGPVKTGVEPLW